MQRMGDKKGILNKIKWFFGSYRFVTQDGIKNSEELKKKIRYDPALSTSENVYCGAVFSMALVEFVSHLLGMKGCGYKDKLLSTLYLMLSMSSLNQFMNKSKAGKMGETLRWMLMVGLLSADRLIGREKVPMFF